MGLGRPISRGTKDPIRSFCLCPCLWGPLEQPLWARLALWSLRWPSTSGSGSTGFLVCACSRVSDQLLRSTALCTVLIPGKCDVVHLHDVQLERERCIITAMHHRGRPVPFALNCTAPPFRCPCCPGGPLQRPPYLLHPARVVVPTGPGPTSPPKGSPPLHPHSLGR